VIFVLGAVLSGIGLGAQRFSRSPAYIASLAAFALAIASLDWVSVVFLGLFLVPTFLIGVSSQRFSSPWTLVMYAASDALLAMGITQRHADLDIWSLPAAGGWEAGAILIGLASLLRLAAPWRESPGPSFLGWWQGLFLVWWTSNSAGMLFGIGGALLVAVALVAPTRNRGLLVAGGIASMLGAAGWTEALFAVGLAGCAFTLGERAVGSFVLAAQPFSAVWAAAPSEISWGILPGIAVPLVVLAGSQALVSSGLARWGGRVPALAAAVATVSLLAMGGSLFAWAIYGLGLALVVTVLMTKPHPAIPESVPQALPQEFPRPGVRLVAYLLLAGASLLFVRLMVIGVGTRFL
jgi:hypothetical protein